MKPSTEQDYRERMVRTLIYIEQHLDEELELDQVASVGAPPPVDVKELPAQTPGPKIC
jgi:YesN/AraC family two-component response regulator